MSPIVPNTVAADIVRLSGGLMPDSADNEMQKALQALLSDQVDKSFTRDNLSFISLKNDEPVSRLFKGGDIKFPSEAQIDQAIAQKVQTWSPQIISISHEDGQLPAAHIYNLVESLLKQGKTVTYMTNEWQEVMDPLLGPLNKGYFDQEQQFKTGKDNETKILSKEEVRELFVSLVAAKKLGIQLAKPGVAAPKIEQRDNTPELYLGLHDLGIKYKKPVTISAYSTNSPYKITSSSSRTRDHFSSKIILPTHLSLQASPDKNHVLILNTSLISGQERPTIKPGDLNGSQLKKIRETLTDLESPLMTRISDSLTLYHALRKNGVDVNANNFSATQQNLARFPARLNAYLNTLNAQETTQINSNILTISFIPSQENSAPEPAYYNAQLQSWDMLIPVKRSTSERSVPKVNPELQLPEKWTEVNNRRQ